MRSDLKSFSSESDNESAAIVSMTVVRVGHFLDGELGTVNNSEITQITPHEPSALDITESLLGLGWKSARLLC